MRAYRLKSPEKGLVLGLRSLRIAETSVQSVVEGLYPLLLDETSVKPLGWYLCNWATSKSDQETFKSN